MKRAGRARRQVLASLCPPADLIVDVGADHGHVAHLVGAVATERQSHRAGRPDVPWVICDGLSAFRHVPVAIIAGMGANTIAGILARGPRPDVLIAHAPDEPGTLRTWLAAHGWRIDAEALAPEGRRWAEVLRAVPGTESASGLELFFGPRLLEGDDAHLEAHLRHHHGYWAHLAETTAGADPTKHVLSRERADFLASRRLARFGDATLPA